MQSIIIINLTFYDNIIWFGCIEHFKFNYLQPNRHTNKIQRARKKWLMKRTNKNKTKINGCSNRAAIKTTWTIQYKI